MFPCWFLHSPASFQLCISMSNSPIPEVCDFTRSILFDVTFSKEAYYPGSVMTCMLTLKKPATAQNDIYFEWLAVQVSLPFSSCFKHFFSLFVFLLDSWTCGHRSSVRCLANRKQNVKQSSHVYTPKHQEFTEWWLHVFVSELSLRPGKRLQAWRCRQEVYSALICLDRG